MYGGHELGKRYYISYWATSYEVVQIHELQGGAWAVTVKWADGTHTTHGTSLGKYDKELTQCAS